MSSVADHIDPTHWRISYLVTAELDLGMPEKFQRYLIERARGVGAEVDVKTVKSGHFPQISHADEVARWVLALV
jgi:hypothetical protein